MMKHYIFVICAILFCTLPVAAQNGIDSKVEVTRDYQGQIMKSGKAFLNTDIADSLYNFKLKFDYSTFYRPYSDLYEFLPQHTAEPVSDGRITYPWLYMRLGMAYPLMPVADVYVAPRLGNRFSFSVCFNHNSFWGKRLYATDLSRFSDFGRQAGDRMSNRAGAAMMYRWNTGEVRMDVEYSNNRYAYIDTAATGSMPSHTFDKFKATLASRSTNRDRNAFYYDVNVTYGYLGDVQNVSHLSVPYGMKATSPAPLMNGITEHSVLADASFGATIKYYHKLYIDAENETILQKSGVGGEFFGKAGRFSIAPTYKWEKERWRIGAGIGVSVLYGASKRTNGYNVVPLMDFNVEFEALRDAIWVYAKAESEQSLYSLYEISSVNPWFDNVPRFDLIRYAPVDVEVGMRGVVKDRFAYGLKLNYVYLHEEPSFYFNGGYQTPLSVDCQMLDVGVFLRWKSKDVYASLNMDYRYFMNGKSPLMIPAFDLKAEVEYNIRRRVFFNAGCYFRTSVTGAASMAGEMVYCDQVPAFVDLNLRITWAINSRVSIYAEGKNLANNKVQYMFNYLEPGLSVGGGICLKL